LRPGSSRLWGCVVSIALGPGGAACGADHGASGELSQRRASSRSADAQAAPGLASEDAGVLAPDVSDGGAMADATSEPSVELTPEQMAEVLFVDPAEQDAALASCGAGSATERGRCLLRGRYADDGAASVLALRLYEVAGSVAGLEPEHVMDGGWRGRLRLVPELPVGGHRRHLKWVVAAAEDHERFFVRLREGSPASMHYRHRDLGVHFFRSVGRTTPSAYATDWRVAYNVSGSLHKSAAAVSETLFHEVFHLNDADHGDWSRLALTPLFEAVVARCGTDIACLRPYAPNHTLVRGGTYYAFQPGNGVWEYAAELAIRYFREHRRRLGLPTVTITERAFKCGPEENGRAWQLLVDEFFGGVDLVPPCPTPHDPGR